MGVKQAYIFFLSFFSFVEGVIDPPPLKNVIDSRIQEKIEEKMKFFGLRQHRFFFSFYNNFLQRKLSRNFEVFFLFSFSL